MPRVAPVSQLDKLARTVTWSLDFIYDQFTEECLGAMPDTSISGQREARS
jgi:hypothetical protein